MHHREWSVKSQFEREFECSFRLSLVFFINNEQHKHYIFVNTHLAKINQIKQNVEEIITF